MAKKMPEKELYALYLDLLFSFQDATERAESLAEELKRLRGFTRNAKRSLGKVRDHYKEVHGKYPSVINGKKRGFPTDPFEEGK